MRSVDKTKSGIINIPIDSQMMFDSIGHSLCISSATAATAVYLISYMC